jgi:hypothetical protein
MRIAAWAAGFAQRAEGERRPADAGRGDSALERAALALWRLPEAGT